MRTIVKVSLICGISFRCCIARQAFPPGSAFSLSRFFVVIPQPFKKGTRGEAFHLSRVCRIVPMIPINSRSAPRSNLCKKKRDAQLSIAFWWERVDSNHRSYKQQIYSLSPLATREHSHILFCVVRTPECLFIIAGGRCKCKLFLKKFLIFSIFLLLPSNHLFFSSNHLVFSHCGIYSIF